MNLLRPFRRPPAPRRRRRMALDWVEQATPSPDPDDAAACAQSWFDSSWVLRAGLQITEHESVDGLSNDLPLTWWIDGPASRPGRE